MKFEDIKYVERDGNYGKTQGLYLDGNWVSKRKLTYCRDSAYVNQDNIDLSCKQCAESLMSSSKWHWYKKRGQKIALGRCFAFLVQYDLLPWKLKVANPDESGKRIYVTADTVLPPTIMPIRIISLSAAQALQLTQHKKPSTVRVSDIRFNRSLPSPVPAIKPPNTILTIA